MEKTAKIYVAGHQGLVGSAVIRKLKSDGYENLVFRGSNDLDLRRQAEVEEFFSAEKPEYVFLAAAKVGGIHANNTYPADFLMENMQIQCNVIDCAYKHKAKKLLFLGSSCIYPKMSPQPIKEEYLLTSSLEPTNEAYALAKISGIKMCQYYNKQYGTKFISVMPTNLYGPNDNFDLQNSHVLPALIRKTHEAKINQLPFVEVWGTGKPLREFLHVDDLADACTHLMETYEGNDFINIGTGNDVSIRELAMLIMDVVGHKCELRFNTDKPDGSPKKLLDVSRLEALGWRYRIKLEDGIRQTYNWYIINEVS